MAEPAARPSSRRNRPDEPPPPPRRARQGTCPSTSPESKFWRSFRNSQLSSGLIHPVTHLDFSPAPPHDLAASVSTNLPLYAGVPSHDLSPKPFSPLQHFDDVAYSPSFRCDGSLLAAGGHSGLVQVFDPHRARPPLRRLRGHSRPVRVVRYPRAADKAHLFSGGDDAVLNYWDVVTETAVLSIGAAHKDYIRAGAASPVRPEVFATGSYDHLVRLWDIRAPGGSVAAFNHGDPVECALFLSSGGLIATAGGNVVKIWDVIGGGRMIHRIDCHNKTVTSLCLGRVGKEDGGESRLLTASLDGYVKVFDYASFRITHSTRYPSMLLSVAFSPVGNVLITGTSNGVIYIGKKKPRKEETQAVDGKADDEYIVERERVKPALRPTYFRYFQRGQSEKPSMTDIVVKQRAKIKLAEHDKLLKKFEHKEALVCVLERKSPNIVVAVMQELVARRKLLAVVKALDDEGLGLLLGFLHRNATMARYARFLMGLATKVLEMREEEMRSSAELRTHARNIKRMVAEEIQIQRTLQEIQGMISPLLRIAGR